MKRFAIGLLFVLPIMGQQCIIPFTITNRAQDATDGKTVIAAPGATPAFNNTTIGCTSWQFLTSVNGFSALSIVFQSATDAYSTGGTYSTFAGTTISGSNPSTATDFSTYVATGYYPFIRVNATAVTGTGYVRGLLLGWRSINGVASNLNYYVDPSGSDSNNGKSPSTPFATVAKINGITLSAGQKIGFKRGNIWREQITTGQNGLSGRQITYTAYGSGSNPVITGADLMVGFAFSGTTNIWTVSLATQPTILLFNSVIGTLVASQAAVISPLNWFYDTGTTTLSVYSTANPSTNYTNPGIEASQRDYAIQLNKNFITVNNLTLEMGNGLADAFVGNGAGTGSNAIISNCEIRNSTSQGVYLFGTQNSLVYNNYIHDIWNGVMYPGQTGTGVQIFGSTALNNTINLNLLRGNSKGIGINGGGGSNSPLGTLITFNVIDGTKVNGIDQSQSNSATNPTRIYNNTVIHNPTGTSGHGIDIQDTGSDGWDARNNLVYTPFTGTNTNVEGISISSDITLTTVTVDYNLHYLTPGSTANLAQDNSGTRYNTLATWQTFLASTTYIGKEVHSVTGDPLFNNLVSKDYTLQASSPALGTGTCIVGITSCPVNIGSK